MGGGNNKQKKSSSFFSFFKPRRSRRDEEVKSPRNFPSDYDKVLYIGQKSEEVPYIADPRIDTKASAFIADYYATRVLESEVQYCSAGKA